ncbi:hypothetical protein PIB30_016398 [Stylosanthes scabra]|uniref:RRM domain-containing protein n=1 Tax=Stylosanthes scabra TaxID=79078 RepID=A0ABU6U657_9FABA|nr:hypothetical protein [Stylosanthes scabra]
MANPSSSSSSQFTYSSDPSYFPTPFHLQQPPYAPPPRPPPPTVAAAPAAAPYTYPPPPSHHHQFQRDAQQLFQRDAQTITPEALESVKAAIASSDVDHKADAKRKAVPRRAAGQTWEDPSLAEFPSFNMARVVRDKRSGKTKGYGFVSFADPSDLAVALKEMNGKYVGNRPIKLCKSKWKERTDYDAVDKQKKHSKKKLKSSSKLYMRIVLVYEDFEFFFSIKYLFSIAIFFAGDPFEQSCSRARIPMISENIPSLDFQLKNTQMRSILAVNNEEIMANMNSALPKELTSLQEIMALSWVWGV